MAIEVLTGEYVPQWVHAGFFPEADEVALSALAKAWATQAKACTERETELTTMLRGLADKFSGPAADTATTKITKVGKYLDSTGKACSELEKTMTASATIVTFAKTAINLILTALQVKSQQLMGKQSGIGKLVVIVQLRQLQIAAQAQIRGVHDAAVAKLAELSPSIDIQPKLTMPKGTTSKFAPNGAESLFRQHVPANFAPGGPGTSPGTGTGGPSTGDPDADANQDFWDPNDLVGGDEEQGPEPGTADETTTSDQAFTDEEQQGIQQEWSDQMDQQMGDDPGAPPETVPGGPGTQEGRPTPTYTEEDLTNDANDVSEDEVPTTDTEPTIDPDAPMTPGEVTGENPDGTSPYETVHNPGMPTPAPDQGPPSADSSSGQDADPPGPQPPAYDNPPSGTTPTGTTPGNGYQPPTNTWSPDDHRPDDPPANNNSSYTPPSSSPAPPSDSAPPSPGPAPAPPAPSYPGPGSSTPYVPEPTTPQESGTSQAGVQTVDPPTSHVGQTAPGQVGGVGGGMPQTAQPPAGGAPQAPNPGFGQNLGGGLGAPPPLAGGGVGGGVPAAPPAAAPPMAAPPAAAPPVAAPPVNPNAAVPPPSQPPNHPPNQPHVPNSNQPGGGVREVRPAQPMIDSEAAERFEGADANGEGEAMNLPTAIAAAAAGMAVTGATLALARVWHDLNRPEPPLQRLRAGTAIWPTQFGTTDEPLAVLPAGMGVAYQKVLLPGESDALRAGQVTTVRGLVHPLDQVRHLISTTALHQTLGLGYPVADERGQTELAFDPRPPYLDVLRFNGTRDADLVVPIAEDVEVEPRPGLEHQVRRHARPWQGGGTAPGSSLDHLIEEYEILGETGVAVPHLAEIWRIHSTGEVEHVATHNARSGVWSGDRVAMVQPAGRLAENGHFAVMPDDSVFQAIALTEHEHVLIARGTNAPEFFNEVGDGTHRFVVQNDQIARVVGVKTIGIWQGARVTVLGRVRHNALVDYADQWPHQATQLGFRQLNQGQWQQRWVPMAEIADVTEWEREYARPRIESSIRPRVPTSSGSLTPAGGVGITG